MMRANDDTTRAAQGDSPASLQVFRFTAADGDVRPILGGGEAALPLADLRSRAVEALRGETFMCYAVSQEGDPVGDELCFVPQGDHCDILSIHTNGWQRHHGDHRRSLVEILNTLAAAVACGQLRILDPEQLTDGVEEGEALLTLEVGSSAMLPAVRRAVDEALAAAAVTGIRAQVTVLCVSEAVTNALLHGGGGGMLAVRRLPDRLRFVVADQGDGLNFLNWMEPPATGGQASMGYGFKIILDNLDAVGLRTDHTGTTLLLDRLID
jgi:anti-sigma regulatory factor (Ser/Thr protein kinase)